MISRKLTCFTAIAFALFAALAIPVHLTAQDNRDHKSKHHHYKLIDIGTFGGSSSYVNFYTDVLNDGGTAIGSSQNAMPQPPTTNGFSCPPNIEVYKAFEWNDGVVTNLGALGEGNCSNAIWINGKGEIAGNAENGVVDPLTGVNEIRAVLWEHGKIEDLGTLGGDQSGGQAINDRGDVVGFALNATPDPYSIFDFLFLGSSNGTQTRAVVWRDGKAKDLDTLGGPDAAAWFVNNRGQVAGYSYTSDTPDSNTGIPPVHLILWEQGAMRDLGSLGGVGLPSINGFNNRGEVIGASPLPGDQSTDPFLWDGTHLIDMAIEGKGGQFFDANVINNAGEVAGGAAFPGSLSLASLWKDGIVTDLGAVGTDCYSEAWSISSSGQVGGTSVSCDGNTWRAFLWESGSMVDLRSLVSSGPDLQLVYAIGINDRGEIAGNGVPAGISTAPPFQDTMSHAFVLIPCDENHPGVEGCDYSMVEAPATALQTSPPVRDAPSRLLPQSLLRRMNRFHFPGSAFGPRN
jgi:probable HAF family extracellular repeat protein